MFQVKLKELETSNKEAVERKSAQLEEQYKMLEVDNKHFQVSLSDCDQKQTKQRNPVKLSKVCVCVQCSTFFGNMTQINTGINIGNLKSCLLSY